MLLKKIKLPDGSLVTAGPYGRVLTMKEDDMTTFKTIFKTITDRVDDATRIAQEHGWGWSEEDKKGVLDGTRIHRLLSDLALVHSEVSEAVEAGRDGALTMTGGVRASDTPGGFGLKEGQDVTKPEGLVVELADAVIRIMHLCGELDLPLEDAIIAKMKYNESRPFKHGGRKA